MRKSRRWLLDLAVVIALSSSPALVLGAQQTSDLDAYILGAMARSGLPGVQATAVKDGKVVWTRSYGMRELSPPSIASKPMTNDSIFEIASISKTFFAVAVMQLVEAGRIHLADDINLYLPQELQVRNPAYPETAITWEMLLLHTSSLTDAPEIFYDPSILKYGSDAPESLHDILVDLFGTTGKYYSKSFLPKPPGTIYKYCNACVDLGAYAIELLVGKPYYQYVRENIFDPLTMSATDTGYFLKDLPVEDKFVAPYGCDADAAGVYTCIKGCDSIHMRCGDSVLAQQLSYPLYPEGLVHTTTTEYAKFMIAIMGGGVYNGKRLLSSSSVDYLLTQGRFSNGTPVEDGGNPSLRQAHIFYEFPGNDLGAGTIWGHSGDDVGVASVAFFDRGNRVGAIVFTNSQNKDYSVGLTGAMIDIARKLMMKFK